MITSIKNGFFKNIEIISSKYVRISSFLAKLQGTLGVKKTPTFMRYRLC